MLSDLAAQLAHLMPMAAPSFIDLALNDLIFLFSAMAAIFCGSTHFFLASNKLGTSVRERRTLCANLQIAGQSAILVGVLHSPRPVQSPVDGELCSYSMVRLFDPSAKEDAIDMLARHGKGFLLGTIQSGNPLRHYDYGVGTMLGLNPEEEEASRAGTREFVPDWAHGLRLSDETGAIDLVLDNARVEAALHRTVDSSMAIQSILKRITGESASAHMLEGSTLMEEYLPINREVVLHGHCVPNPDEQSIAPLAFEVDDISVAPSTEESKRADHKALRVIMVSEMLAAAIALGRLFYLGLA
ncbi:MAG: hypothetical protein IKC51_03100 [Myxococcaceae bacterium]|nr:hypothetical protein [Myxococcaceae bacterium]